MTAQEQAVTNFVGNANESKRNLRGERLATPPKSTVHIFSIAYGVDADLEALRIFAEAANSTFKQASEKNIVEVLEVFGKYL